MLSRSDSVLVGMKWSGATNSWNGGAVNAYGATSNDQYISLTCESCSFQSCSSTTVNGQGNGGAICCWYGKLTLSSCDFRDCRAGKNGGGACIQSGELVATECNFSGCSAELEGGAVAVYLDGTTEQKGLLLKKCDVLDCMTTGPSVLFFNDISSAEFEENTIENCSAENCVLTMTCQSFTWAGNSFHLSVEGASASCIQINCQGESERVVEESRFSNDGKEVGRFFSLNQLGSWRFHMCSFTSIKTPQDSGEGTAILVNTQDGVTDLEVTDSNFTDLSCYGNGGAIHVAGIHFSLIRCCFDSCQSRVGDGGQETALGGSGGVYIECTAHGEVEDCTFINNTAAINGQSLQIMIPHDASKIQVSVSNCTFKGHESPSVLCFGQYEGEDRTGLACSTFRYTIFNCTFQDNTYTSTKFGLVIARSTVGLSYEYCTFLGNRGGLLSLSDVESGPERPSFGLSNCLFEDCHGTGLIFAAESASVGSVSFEDCDFKSCKAPIIQLHSLTTSLTLSGCSFEECTGDEHQILVGSVEGEGQEKTIKIDDCSFTGCQYASGMIAVSADGVRQLDISNNQFMNCHSTASSSILMTTAGCVSEILFNHNTLSDCTGAAGDNTGSIITIHSENISFCNNSFHLTSESVAIFVDVASRSSIVQDTLFSISPVTRQLQSGESLAIIGLSCQGDAEIEFYNCCFTQTENLGAGYLTMNNIGGKVVFSDVCFDIEESKAIKYGTEEDKQKVEFSGGNRDGFFVVCQCWEPIRTVCDSTEEDIPDITTDETSYVDELETSESDEP